MTFVVDVVATDLLLSPTSLPVSALAAKVVVVVALVAASDTAAKPNLNCVAGVAAAAVADVAAAVAGVAKLLLKPNINLGAEELLTVSATVPGFSCSQQMHL